MLTLLASLLGFISSGMPDLFRLLRDRADKQHELALLDKQLELQRDNAYQQRQIVEREVDAVEAQAMYQHDSSLYSSVKWIEALRASVRPVLTYAFFMLFAFVKIAALIQLLQLDVSMIDGVIVIWDSETRALFAAVISFWFGRRSWKTYSDK